MYYVIGTVTSATPTELKVTCNCPLDWVQAPDVKSSEIQRKLLPGEIFSGPTGSVVEQELLGNRLWQPDLELGDKVVVRLFFPGESR
jgi:hypothetical protein